MPNLFTTPEEVRYCSYRLNDSAKDMQNIIYELMVLIENTKNYIYDEKAYEIMNRIYGFKSEFENFDNYIRKTALYLQKIADI